jgi:hypothetical protein
MYHLHTLRKCLMSISRFSLRDKVTLRLLKLYFYIADVVEWSRLIQSICIWTQTLVFKYNIHLKIKPNSVRIRSLSWQICVLPSTGFILYGCHPLRCLYNILYFLWLWWIIHHPIQYIKNCWVRLLSNYDIKYICTIYIRLDRCLLSISRFSLRDKATTRLFQL